MEYSSTTTTDLYQITMMENYRIAGKDGKMATFDLFVRNLPPSRNYLMAAGLREALDYLENLRFNERRIDFLTSLPQFQGPQHKGFEQMLRDFKFEGEVWAVREGMPVFANEPWMTIKAPLSQAQLPETYLLALLGSATMWASKASRIVDEASPHAVMDLGLRRAHGPEAGIRNALYSYIGGFAGTSNVEAGFQFGIPVFGTMAHANIMSGETQGSKSELTEFRHYAKSFPDYTVLLVDTYDIEQGIKNAIIVAKELEKVGKKLVGIRLDSGDLAFWSQESRKMLDAAGLNYVKITLSNDLDDVTIRKLNKDGSAHDTLGVGTMQASSKDSPHMPVVYKLSEIEVDGVLQPRIKESQDKSTLPGFKQSFYFVDSMGVRTSDEITLMSETRPKGVPLLEKVMEGGKRVIDLPTLDEVRTFAAEQRDILPKELRRLERTEYHAEISVALDELRGQVRRAITEERNATRRERIVVRG